MIKKSALFLLFSIICIQNSYAGIDAMELALSEPYQGNQTLRWDNVVSKPLWLNHEKPIYFSQWKLQGIRLPAVVPPRTKTTKKPFPFWQSLGQSILAGLNHAAQFFDQPIATQSPFYNFYLPPYQSFRLYNPDQALQPKDLTIYLSNGSGLLAEADLQRSQDGHSIIISAKSESPLLVHVAASGEQTTPIEMAAFISRYETINPIAPYRHLQWLSGEFVWLSKQPKLVPEIYWQMDAFKEQTVTVEGPSRLLIKNRLHYENEANQIRQDYRISYQLNDQKPIWMNLSTEVETNGQTYINNEIKTLGRQQKVYLEIPAGKHLLKLNCDRNLFLRLLAQQENDYLFPNLNQPPLSVKTVREKKTFNQHELVKANQLAQTLVRDNSNKSAPLVGQQLLKQSSFKHLEYKAASIEAKKLYGQRTFYRNLFPQNKNSTGEQFYAYFSNKKLPDFQRLQQHAVVAEQHQSSALKRLGNAYFSPITSSPTIFYLLERKAPTQLRLIIDKSHCQETQFSLQMDQQAPQDYILNCQKTVIKDAKLVRSMAETALLTLSQKTSKSDQITLDPLFSSYRNSARLLTAASFEINLPQPIQQLSIKCLENKPCPLNLAVQIRASKTHQFSEQSYLAHMHNKSEIDLLKLMNNRVDDAQHSTDITEKQITNQWVALKRFLNKQNRAFKSTLPSITPSRNKTKQSDVANWQVQALLAENNEQWTDALGFWNRIVENSKGSHRDQALVAQAKILTSLSENYLAKSLWRFILINADPVYAKQAENHLLNLFQQQNDNLAIQQLAATRYMQRPERKNLHFLLQSLVNNSKYRYALLLGLTLSEPPLKLMLTSAYHLEWWQSYEQLLSRLPQSQQAFWLGLKAQKFNDFETAIKHWSTSENSDWLEHLQTGMTLRQKISDNIAVEPLYSAWKQWKTTHPGKSIWHDATRLIKDSAGTDTFFDIERNLQIKGFRATQERPVKLTVLGPTQLNIKLRTLHTQMNSQLNGMIDIVDNTKHSVHLVSDKKPTQSLTLISKENQLPGNLFSFKYQVGEGFHEIELSSKDFPISIAINELKPEFPLTVLAPLQINTLANASSVEDSSLKRLITTRLSTSTAIVDADLTQEKLSLFAAVVNESEAEKRMLQYLFLLQQNKKNTGLLFYAEKLQKQFPNNLAVKLLWQKISRFSEWQPVDSIISEAGIRFIKTQGWQPVNPVIQVRKALLSKINADEHVVFSDQRLVLLMDNFTAKKLDFAVQLDDIAFLPDNPATFNYQIDQQNPRSLVIQRKQDWKKISQIIPKGKHQIRFWLSQPVTNQYLKIRFDDQIPNLDLSKEKSYFVSTKKNPLQLNVQGPVILRIDQWQDNEIISRYQEVAEGWQHISLPPDNQQQESLLFVRHRVAIEKQKTVRNRIVKQKIIPLTDNTIPINQTKPEENIEIDDFFTLGRQEDGTWSIGTDFVRRNNVQEDIERGDPEDFQQLNLNHRYFDSYRDLYWDTKGFIRARKEGGPTFGINESIRISNDQLPFKINFEAKVISQIVDEDPEWLGQLKLRISHLSKITPSFSITPELSWFGRYMSLRNDQRLTNNTETEDIIFKQKVDQDIFTRYKSQHSSGLSASLLFTHDPWLDTRWTAKIKTVSNENLNLFIPDYFSTEAHWKQIMGSVSLDTSYRVSFFQKDKDRRNSVIRQATKLKLNWQLWTHHKNRLEMSGLYNYDIDRDSHLGMISFTYHFGEGRKYRDFKPGKIDFQQIRERWSLNE